MYLLNCKCAQLSLEGNRKKHGAHMKAVRKSIKNYIFLESHQRKLHIENYLLSRKKFFPKKNPVMYIFSAIIADQKPVEFLSGYI